MWEKKLPGSTHNIRLHPDTPHSHTHIQTGRAPKSWIQKPLMSVPAEVCSRQLLTSTSPVRSLYLSLITGRAGFSLRVLERSLKGCSRAGRGEERLISLSPRLRLLLWDPKKSGCTKLFLYSKDPGRLKWMKWQQGLSRSSRKTNILFTQWPLQISPSPSILTGFWHNKYFPCRKRPAPNATGINEKIQIISSSLWNNPH